MELTVDGYRVATYVVEPELDPTLSPRPYLHPIRTLGGHVISDALPGDHPWHLGLSLAVQDVNGTNLWGGRTYVRGQGYTWLDDHGTITHEGFDRTAADHLVQRLAWRGRDGRVLLTERREIRARPAGTGAWALELAWALRAGTRVVLGSPTTNGRELGAGYGGCFLRIARGPDPEISAGPPGDPEDPPGGPPTAADGPLLGEREVNGCDRPEVVWRSDAYTLRFSGAERWFVRSGIYPGVCAAWAFENVRTVGAGECFEGRFRMVVGDG